jgi:bacillithiol biosynthesis cysteine-adding enzyme BshC
MIVQNLTDIWSPFVPELVEKFMTGAWDIQQFVQRAPDLASIQSYADIKVFAEDKRNILGDILSDQYKAIGWSQKAVLDNIASLRQSNVFTITTGQQVHVFLWPVFFVTKILDCIAVAQQATEQGAWKKFVPVFWMATEDHDFAEINTVSVYNTPFVWEQSAVGGPVGRLSPKTLDSMLDQLRERLDKTELHAKYLDIFAYAYSNFSTLAQATHYVLDQLFGDKGLVVINGDDANLKKLFVPILSADILEQQSYPAIMQQTDALVALGWKKQAHPREINVFYMTDGHRGRIIQEGDSYIVDGTDIRFTHDALMQQLEQSPASFSPNVFLRPLYQETILPNVLYIPGPAEFNYWLQMKELFAVHGLTMPVVIPRSFNQFVSAKNYEKIQTGPVSLASYFWSYDIFLDAIKKVDTEVLADTQKVIAGLESSLAMLQETFVQKQISHKKITKSLTAISSELSTLSTTVDAATSAALEESETYAPYIKIKKNLFDLDHRFERDNFVIGQLSVIDGLIHQEKISVALGKVLLYIYD